MPMLLWVEVVAVVFVLFFSWPSGPNRDAGSSSVYSVIYSHVQLARNAM